MNHIHEELLHGIPQVLVDGFFETVGILVELCGDRRVSEHIGYIYDGSRIGHHVRIDTWRRDDKKSAGARAKLTGIKHVLGR